MNFKIALSLLVVLCVGCAVAADETTSEPPTTATVTSGTTAAESTTAAKSTATSHPSTATSHPSTATQPTTGASTTAKPSDLWGVQYKNGSYCILLKADIWIEFQYNSSETNKLVQNKTSVPPPAQSTATGSCGHDTQSIVIQFLTDWQLTLVFKRTGDNKYYQSEVGLQWNLAHLNWTDAPHISGNDSSATTMFNTSTGYLCTSRIKLYANSSVENGLSTIYTENLKLEAFQNKKDAKFSDKYERCSEDTISNLVPIIVGACLGGLIIIVLIAYLIGRKRSRRGYESV